MVNKVRGDIVVLVCDICGVNWKSWRDVPEDIKTVMIDTLAKYVPENAKKVVMDQLVCNYTLDETDKELMKLMDEALNGGYKRCHYAVEQNGGPSKL
ncbi:hypothetical protein C1H46_023092 [Malus baccata]|uniref:Uncharacterized protein n=1 Tax=Malus baccata TaxID=106549 RepID=A0A540LXW3_MALBA|nr:hypothetical protein C1H46_023092 [Malus baccata]